MGDNQALKEIVGNENVIESEERLDSYTHDMSFVQPIRPRCVLKPKNTQEVQSIIQWANKTGCPVIPVSSGPPHFKGDTIPSIGGAIIMELSEMKNYIRIDRRNRVAIIEPGITFGELTIELKKNDLAPFMPLLPRKTKSVIGSYLEREPITMPRHHWDSQDPLLCLELIFGNGDLFRTGSAAGPGTLEEQWEVGRAQVRPMGPSQMDPARYIQGSQGGMGVVTWASIKCRVYPKMKRAYFVTADKLDKLVDFTYKVMWKRLGEDCFIINSVNLATICSANIRGISSLLKKLPAWILFWSVEGVGLFPEERITYQETDFKETAASYGLKPVTVLSDIEALYVAELLTKPSEEPYWKLKMKGGVHDIFFISTMDRHDSFIRKHSEITNIEGFSENNVGVYIQPTVQGTNCHFEFSYYYDPQDKLTVEKVKNIDIKLPRQLAANQAFFSRPYGSWNEVAYGASQYMVIAQRIIKDTYDPNKIMNPGKLCF